MRAIILLVALALAPAAYAHDTDTRHIHPKAEDDGKVPKMKVVQPPKNGLGLKTTNGQQTNNNDDHVEMLELGRQNSLSTGLEAD